jgi:hypothetical protein
MGHFNVLKGAYPHLQQLDKTLPLGTGGDTLVRGSAMYASAGKFVPAANDVATHGVAGTPGPIIYFCLQNAADPDVKMANGVTGLSCTMPMEVETDQFDDSAIVLGCYLMASAGNVSGVPNTPCVSLHTTGCTAIGLVTKAAYTRWSNNAVAVAGVKTGNKISVISFWTMYAPELAV